MPHLDSLNSSVQTADFGGGPIISLRTVALEEYDSTKAVAQKTSRQNDEMLAENLQRSEVLMNYTKAFSTSKQLEEQLKETEVIDFVMMPGAHGKAFAYVKIS